MNIAAWYFAAAAAALVAIASQLDGPTDIEAARDIDGYTPAMPDQSGVALCAATDRVPLLLASGELLLLPSGDLICRKPEHISTNDKGAEKL